MLVCDFGICIKISWFWNLHPHDNIFVICSTFVFPKMLCILLHYYTKSRTHPGSMQQPVWPFQQICFTLCKHTMTHTRAGVFLPWSQMQACSSLSETKPPLQSKRNSSGPALQAGLGLSQSQPNSSGVFDGSHADQKSERRHWSEVL